MAEPVSSLTRRSAFAPYVAALPAVGEQADVRLTDHAGLGIAALLAHAGTEKAMADTAMRCGLSLPDGPRATFSEGTTVVGTGPGTWLVVAETPEPAWPTELATAFAGIASVTDQSSGYAVLRIAGDDARALLARGPFIDLDATSFGPGAAAVTLVAHMGVILWQRDAAPTFEAALFRSYAGSFWHWLRTAAADAGLSLAQGR